MRNATTVAAAAAAASRIFVVVKLFVYLPTATKEYDIVHCAAISGAYNYTRYTSTACGRRKVITNFLPLS